MSLTNYATGQTSLFKVTPDELKAAVNSVGTSAKDVEEVLKKKK
jgi:Protein of unknown function (DUF3606)